ncbi:hypothetical protein Csa_002825, partial [Cucumis sativus]
TRKKLDLSPIAFRPLVLEPSKFSVDNNSPSGTSSSELSLNFDSQSFSSVFFQI